MSTQEKKKKNYFVKRKYKPSKKKKKIVQVQNMFDNYSILCDSNVQSQNLSFFAKHRTMKTKRIYRPA